MARYRILSIDGGGLRGVIAARLLKKLNDEPRIRGFLDHTQLYAGTSTGAFIALGLAAGKTPHQLEQIYLQDGKSIFADNKWDNFLNMGRWFRADYKARNLESVLAREFGDTTLGDLAHKVIVPTFDLDNIEDIEQKRDTDRHWKAKMFHNFKRGEHNLSTKLRDIARYTSAAPTFFSAKDGFIDGGVVANNPAMVALAQAISRHNAPEEKQQLDDLVILSVGTGTSLEWVEDRNPNWGYLRWAKKLLAILFEGSEGIANYQCQQLLGDQYQRLQTTLPKEYAMDDVSKLPQFLALAEAVDLEPAIRFIQTRW